MKAYTHALVRMLLISVMEAYTFTNTNGGRYLWIDMQAIVIQL